MKYQEAIMTHNMKLKAPINEQFKQVNKGEQLGDIYSSRNIDLDTKWGRILTSSPVLAETLSSDETTHPQSTPFSFTRHRGSVGGITTDRFWTIAKNSSDKTVAFETAAVNGTFDEDSESPDMDGLPEESDLLAFNSKLYAASGNDLYERSGTDWATVSTGLDDDAHLLSVYDDRLYITMNQEIWSMNTSEVIIDAVGSGYFLDIDSAGNQYLQISAIRSGKNGLWIGTRNTEGGRAKVLFWDGVTENAVDDTYKIDAAGVVAMAIRNEVPYVLGSNGVLFEFNGSYFKEIDRLNFGNYFTHNFTAGGLDKFVHPNGMIVVRDEILIAVNNRSGEDDVNNDPVPPRVPSGVWAWSEKTGLYHKHSLGMQQDSTTVNDYGQVELVEVGGMYPLYESDAADENYNQSDFLVGYAFKTNNTTTKYAIGVNNKRGSTSASRTFNQASYFISPFMKAEEVKELWKDFYLNVIDLQNATDKIIVKYRTKEYLPTEMNITWVNTTSFTTTDSAMAAIKTNFEANIDYEFEGLQGDGAGQLAHVTNITVNSGTYTVTLDETITGATTNTARVRLDRWTKIRAYTNAEGEEVPSFKTGAVSARIQYKVYMFGKNVEVFGYLLGTETHQPMQ